MRTIAKPEDPMPTPRGAGIPQTARPGAPASAGPGSIHGGFADARGRTSALRRIADMAIRHDEGRSPTSLGP